MAAAGTVAVPKQTRRLYLRVIRGKVTGMKTNLIERGGQVIDLPNFSAVIERDGA